MANDSYKTFRVSVRPARVVCFISLHEEDWQKGALTIVEAFSRVWGGAYFIIVPTDGQIISDAFWRILLAYDPDYLWVYNSAPEDSYESSLELSEGLQQELKLRLAPFHFEDQTIQDWAYKNFKPKYPYTDLITILPNCNHPGSLIEVREIEGVTKLWVSAITGRASSEYKEALSSIEIGHSLVDYSSNLSELFSIASRGIEGQLTGDDKGFPYAFSLNQLSIYRSTKFPYWLEATLVVVGETLEDFCLYYCLARMRRKAMWLLPSWLPSDGTDDYSVWSAQTLIGNFLSALKELAKGRGQESNIFLLSISLSQDEITAVRNKIERSWYRLDLKDGLPTGSTPSTNVQNQTPALAASLEWLLQYPFRIYEAGNAEKTVSRHFLGEDMAGFIDPPKPKNFSFIHPYEHRWITELAITNHQLPRHPLLGDRVVLHGLLGTLGSRVGRDGIAFFCPSSSYIGGDIDQTLVKPSIHLPSGFSLFQLLIKNIGYETQLSDKGRFTLDMIIKFGSIALLAYFFLSNNKRSVLEKYLETKKPGQGVTDEGLFLQSDRRRYLDFTAVKKIMGSDKLAADLIDTLIGQSVLHRGLVLKCEYCRSTDWFSVTDLSHEFRCKRCSRTQVYRQSHALSRLEPPWYYKLDEIVFKGLANDVMIPLLALHHLSLKTDSFLFSVDTELLDKDEGKQLFELDICCVPNGELTIGEAKKNNRLGKTAREEREEVDKYFNLAEKLGASQVVFATYSEQWRPETEQLIRERFSSSLTKPILLTKSELHKAY